MARPAPTTGRPASPVPVAEAEALAAELEAELADLEAEEPVVELALPDEVEAEAAVSVGVEDADEEPVDPEAEPVVVAEPEADADAEAELELAEAEAEAEEEPEAEAEAEMLPETEALGQRLLRSDWADLRSSALQFLVKQSAPLAMMVLMFLQIHVISIPWQSVPLKDWAKHVVTQVGMFWAAARPAAARRTMEAFMLMVVCIKGA